MVCTNPHLLSHIMSLFICTEMHELSLVNLVTKLQQPNQSVMSKQSATIRIKASLSQSSTMFSDFELSNIIEMMIKMKFAINLNPAESDLYNCIGSSLLFPSLRPSGLFKWQMLNENQSGFLTIGRRIFPINEKDIFFPEFFCDLLVWFYLL